MLSERIRPDCEAAPWVCEEVRRLEQAAQELIAAIEQPFKYPGELWAAKDKLAELVKKSPA